MNVQTKTTRKPSFPARYSEGGFTIVEMAIVTMIIGLVFAAAFQLLEQRQRFVRAENTKIAVSNANVALAAFVNNFGRYPCPASLNATRDNNGPLYGVESDCTDTGAVAAGSNVDAALGYAVVTGARNIAYFDRSTVPPTRVPAAGIAPVRVRIGALPFKNLNLQEGQAYDGYQNRLLYAVAEPLAVGKTFSAGGGVIDVQNELDASVLQPQASAHFIILSAGENGAGAYGYEGRRAACLGTSEESQNCDFDVDAIFRVAETGTDNNGAAATYDDLVVYALDGDIPMWELVGANDDAILKTVGDIGIGSVVAANNPGEDLQVDGTLIVRDNPGTSELEGKVESEEICDFTSGSTTCFKSEVIAGDLSHDQGLICGPGLFMTGIQNGAPVCTDEVIVTCPAGKFVTGVDSDGGLICDATPPPSCPSESKNLCSGSGLLPSAPHNTIETITVSTAPTNPGGTRSAKYRCNSGVWEYQSSWGDPCNCTPVIDPVVVNSKASCHDGNNCNGSFTGHVVVTSTTACPSGLSTQVTDRSGCGCLTGTKITPVGCPSGFNKGRKIRSSTYVCNVSGDLTRGACTSPTPAADDPDDPCRCEPVPPFLWAYAPCPLGLKALNDKGIPQNAEFECSGGSDAPGAWVIYPNKNDPAVIAQYCSCSVPPPSNVTRSDCPPGFSGERTYTITKTCDILHPLDPPTVTEEIYKDDCLPDAVGMGKWEVVGGAAGAVSPVVHVGGTCILGTDSPPARLCKKVHGHHVKACLCQ